MAKMIKFDLPIDGVKVATLDDLQDHFTTEIIRHFRSSLLARWLRCRGWTRELAAVEALTADDDATTLKELCRIFEIEADDDAIAAAIAEETGIPGIRPDQMPKKRARTKKRTRNPVDMFQDCPGCPKLVVVPPGSFMMGSPKEEEDRNNDEGPVHEVRIDYSLAVGMYPVTFDEWDACVSDGGCSGYEPDDEGRGRGTHPVINVSWKDADSYVRWLSRKTGQEYRLLSESEWEYVARAGTRTRYWWGNEIGRNRANCYGCGSRWDEDDSLSSPVGSFSANAFGLYDVHGNVAEWVEDSWNESYEGAPTDGSVWKSRADNWRTRVLRGGSWIDDPRDLRSAKREWDNHETRSLYGFRVARTLTP